MTVIYLFRNGPRAKRAFKANMHKYDSCYISRWTGQKDNTTFIYMGAGMSHNLRGLPFDKIVIHERVPAEQVAEFMPYLREL